MSADLIARLRTRAARMDTAGDGMFYYSAFDAALDREAIAALSSGKDAPAGVGVKALGDWRRGYCDDEVTIEQVSTGFGSIYQVRIFEGTIWLDYPVREKEAFPTVEAAKAAAQADYERRILSALAQKDAEPVSGDTHAFKNFHRLLCERFNYTHDEKDWRRDQVSLIEWIAKQVGTHPAPEPAGLEKAVEALAENSWSLVCKEYPIADTGDADVGYEVVSYHMARPKERVEGAGATPVEALRAAGLLPHLSPSPQAMPAKISRKGLEAARLAATELCADGGVPVDDYVAAIVRAYLSTVIPAAEVVEKLRNRGGQVLLEGGYSDPPEPDWLLLKAATLIERLAASQAETRRLALEEAAKVAETTWLTLAIADTVSAQEQINVCREEMATAIRSLGRPQP